ncbi:MAG: hypothetical protein NTZ09_08690 [Candidatus Hydrogenedentes bacterium]|nr:hypothetical protein [Candidatus Hydrogenedentota bacterium]
MHKKTRKKPHYRGKSGCINLPYGWKWTEGNKTIVKDPQEQKNIALGRQLRHKGLSLSQIKAQFDARNVLNRAQDASWTPESIRILLTRDVLTPKWQLRKDRMDARLRTEKKTKREARRAPVVALDEPDPVKWGQGHLANRDGAKRAYWPHQIDDLRADDDNVIHLDGRDVGKTADLSTLALHYALTTEKGTGLVAAALNGQLLSILEEIEFQFERNPVLHECVAVGKNGHRKFQRLPYPRIEFQNGSVLYFRPAGTYGESFRSLHVDRIWVDEGAWLSEEAWRALRQCLRAGGKMRVYSTPNGLRNTTYYRLTESARWRVFRWPSWLNPSWTHEREADLLEFYGGRGSAGWQHEVAGEHGAVSYGAFLPECFERCVRDLLEYRKVTITGQELADCSNEEQSAMRLEMLLGLGLQSGTFWVGGDLGYTRDPMELLVFREMDEVDVVDAVDAVDPSSLKVRRAGGRPEEGQITKDKLQRTNKGEANRQSAICNRKSEIRLVLRVHMEAVSYPQIAQCIGILDAAYSPAGIGLDNGGNGVAVVQELLTLDKYRPRAFSGRLHGFDFGGVTQIPLPDGSDARKRTKELMTSLINGALQRRELVFPAEDREIADQFLTQTYTLSNGIVVYSKGNDHVIDAVRCMMLAREKSKQDWFDDRTPARPPLPLMFETFGGEEEREREYWSEHRMRFFIRE